MRILVVDDHPLMAEAIGLAMRTLDRATEVQSAGSLAAALARAKQVAFDLCLLDLGLPDCSGLEALSRMRETLPALPVVVVSAADDTKSVLAALDLGAMGYIPKTSPRDVLLGAVRLVASGGIYVPVEAVKAREAAEPVPPAAGERAAAAKTMAELGLSSRQCEVLELLLKGLPNKLIARKLEISENTAKIHVSAVLRVLGVATRTQALIAVNRLGLRIDAQDVG
ncbi:MAG TPA: response regulator transcription factor [Burkholderiales bacterium]|nr:response regulator transcription factor [Burkholderiales bacterium]